ncbi:DUF2793 domain-containing protein [Rhodobacteraceae bacterium SC52]|nr:DUF2793 domain-containing protein [Rhodobacteraceae bacterium SC52]
MSASPRSGRSLRRVQNTRAAKHVSHNVALRILDGLVQLSVLDRDLTAPPGSSADGDRYIVASGATGDWAGWELNVAVWTDGAGLRLPPRTGWRAWVKDEGLLLVYDGKPGALRNGAPFTEMPAAFRQLQDHMLRKDGGEPPQPRCRRTHASVAKAQYHRPERPRTGIYQAVERRAMPPVRVSGHLLDDIFHDKPRVAARTYLAKAAAVSDRLARAV